MGYPRSSWISPTSTSVNLPVQISFSPLVRVGFLVYDCVMELRLTVYKGMDLKEVEKEYVSHDFDLPTGACEDILEALDIDTIMDKVKNGADLGSEIVRIVLKSYDKFRPMLFTAFDGLTEDEFRRTKIKDVGNIVAYIAIYTIQSLFSIMMPPKKGEEKKR